MAAWTYIEAAAHLTAIAFVFALFAYIFVFFDMLLRRVTQQCFETSDRRSTHATLLEGLATAFADLLYQLALRWQFSFAARHSDSGRRGPCDFLTFKDGTDRSYDVDR